MNYCLSSVAHINMADNNSDDSTSLRTKATRQNNKQDWTWPFENWTDIFKGRTDDNPSNEELYRMRESMSMVIIMISGIFFVWVSMKFYYATGRSRQF